MFLGKERRDRTVALVLAAALVAVAVLGLLVTLATQGSGSTTGTARPDDRAASPVVPAAAPTATRPAGTMSSVHAHGALPPIEPAGVGVGHPGRLVGMLVGVVLLFSAGLLVVGEVRRREGERDADDAGGEWIS